VKSLKELSSDASPLEALTALMNELFATERGRREAQLLEAGATTPPSRLSAVEPAPAAPRGRARGLVLAAAAVVLVAGAVGAWWATARELSLAPPQPVAVPAAAPAPAPLSKAEPREEVPAITLQPTPTPTEPTPPETIKVQVETVPPGADVRIGERTVGRSPVEVVLSRGTHPLKLKVRRAGNESVEQLLVPDRDQRVVLLLSRQPRPARGAADPLEQKW
jgi:hypothetical protein